MAQNFHDYYLVCTCVSWYCSRANNQLGMRVYLCAYWASDLGGIDTPLHETLC